MSWAKMNLHGASSKWPLGQYRPYPQLYAPRLDGDGRIVGISKQPLATGAKCLPTQPLSRLATNPLFGSGIRPLQRGMAGDRLATPPPLSSCDHVNKCVDKLGGEFRSTMLITAKCGVCSAFAKEGSLWVCLMPECFVAACYEPRDFELDHMQMHYKKNPTHHIQMDVNSKHVYCNACSKMVDISSKFMSKERINVRALANLKLSERDEILYSNITKASMDSNENSRTKALKILSSNPELGQMLPHLLMFVRDGVTAYDKDNSQNLDRLIHLMWMTRALAENTTLSFEKYIHEIITAVGNCVVTPNFSKMSRVNDHFYLRDLASWLMVKLCQASSDRDIVDKVVKKFVAFLKNDTLPLASHYGIISTMQKLGPQYILPCLKSLSRKIDWESKGSIIDKFTAQRTRNLLVKAVSPVLKNLRNPPNLEQFGSIGAYLQVEKVVNSRQENQTKPSHSANTLSRSFLEQQQTATKKSYDNAATAAGLKHYGSSDRVDGGANSVYDDTSMSGRQSDSPEMTKPNGDAGTGLTRSFNQQASHQMGEKTVSQKQAGGPTRSSPTLTSRPSSTSATLFVKTAVESVANIRASVAQANPSTSATSNLVDPGVQAELHVYGVREWISQEIIRANFGLYGTIVGLFLTKKGYCHIKYSSRQEAESCMAAMNGKTFIGKKIKITWATVSKCAEDTVYFIFCEQFGLCYNFNINDKGCRLSNCQRKHVCLFCFELYRTEEIHRSRFECPEEKPGFERYLPQNSSQLGHTSNGD